MARVFLTRQARLHLDELSARLQEPVLNILTDLESDPEATGKLLMGRLKGLWSARVGNYRVIYSIEKSGHSSRVFLRAIDHWGTADP